ncbi:SMI1/KNR4 family protein [Myxococcota bacterium]|nr:SMI1/KNR4 family protein [Myxococcota bacterium]
MDLLREMEVWGLHLGPRSFYPNPPLSEDHLARVERRLGRPLPPSYRDFLRQADGGTFHRFFVDAEPADLDILSFDHHDQPTFVGTFDEMRWTREMPVDLLPVAADGSGNLFGFLLPERPGGGEWRVARFDQEAVALQPLGSSFRTLLRWICLEQELLLDDIGQWVDLPGPQREARELLLHGRMVEFDPGAACSLKRLGLHAFDQGRLDDAERWFVRATEAAPDYSAAWALLARTCARRGDGHRARIAAARAFLGRGIPDGSRGSDWEELRGVLRRHGLPEEIVPGDSPLGRFLLGEESLTTPGPRVAVADALAERGDLAGAVREVEVALYRSSESDDAAPLFDRLERWLRQQGRTLEADLARRDGNVYLEMSASMSMTIDELDLFQE